MSLAEKNEYGPSAQESPTKERSKTKSYEKVQPSRAKRPQIKENDLSSSESQTVIRSKNISRKKAQSGRAQKQKKNTSETVSVKQTEEPVKKK